MALRVLSAAFVSCCLPGAFAAAPAYFQTKLSDAPLLAVAVVKINEGQEVKMLLDTGSSAALLLDRSMRSHVGAAVGKDTLNRTDAEGTLHLLDKLWIGSQELVDQRVGVYDLEPVLSYMGPNVKGVLGMKLFIKKVLVFDFDAGSLSAFDKLPARWMKVHVAPLSGDELHPRVTATVGDQKIALQIDSGSNSAIYLPGETFKIWMERGLIKPAPKVDSHVSVGGTNTMLSGTLTSGELLGLDLNGVSVNRLTRSDLPAFVGLEILRHLNFAINTPGRKIRYEVRAHPAVAYPLERLLGALLRYKGGRCLVEQLKPGGGPFEESGIQVGDEIEAFGTVSGNDLGPHEVYQKAVAAIGSFVEVRTIRNGTAFKRRVEVRKVAESF